MPSRLPQSSQTGLHPRLDAVVRRHLGTRWQQPIRVHAHSAFDAIAPRAEEAVSVVLDSGCGTGESTRWLARRHPDSLVIGIDKSSARLARGPALPDNAVRVRAELADFWRLARWAAWPVSHHYLFYPNPWPKPAHLRRRWHGHPVFPDLLALGGRLELRSNFELYVAEFARALEIAEAGQATVVSLADEPPVSPFERKYVASGHALYQLVVDL